MAIRLGAPALAPALALALVAWPLIFHTCPSLAAETALVVEPNILAELPHDESLFTQGLFLHQGKLYESAGLRGQSRLLVTDPKTGETLGVSRLPPIFFAEGADICGEEIIQLTWTSGVAFRYEPDSLRKIGEFRYQGQGWGLACKDQTLVTSDGSARLTFRDPKTFAPVRHLRVVDGGVPVTRLNELEWVDEFLLANVWQSPRIAVIDPDSGAVRLWLDLSEAVRRSGQTGSRFVLNGIAWDAQSRQLYITGKGWKQIYLTDWPLDVPGDGK
jgi:glutamine cyclotransferase